jgi:hypothetical protein
MLEMKSAQRKQPILTRSMRSLSIILVDVNLDMTMVLMDHKDLKKSRVLVV